MKIVAAIIGVLLAAGTQAMSTAVVRTQFVTFQGGCYGQPYNVPRITILNFDPARGVPKLLTIQAWGKANGFIKYRSGQFADGGFVALTSSYEYGYIDFGAPGSVYVDLRPHDKNGAISGFGFGKAVRSNELGYNSASRSIYDFERVADTDDLRYLTTPNADPYFPYLEAYAVAATEYDTSFSSRSILDAELDVRINLRTVPYY